LSGDVGIMNLTTKKIHQPNQAYQGMQGIDWPMVVGGKEKKERK